MVSILCYEEFYDVLCGIVYVVICWLNKINVVVIFVVKEINIDDFYLELGDGFFFVFLIDDVVLFFFIG